MSKPTSNEPDPINRNTPHAQLLRRLLVSGGLRQWRLEKCIEAVVSLKELDPMRRGADAVRTEANEKLVENAFRLAFEYGDALDAERAAKQYRWAATVIADRLARMAAKEEAKNG